MISSDQADRGRPLHHLEHHLFPRVPTCHLPALAGRLDESVPGLPRKQVF